MDTSTIKEKPRQYYFGSCLLRSDGLLQNGEKEQQLPPKELGVLMLLLENAGRIVTKEEIIDTVWRCPVGDESLTRSVYSLRRMLDKENNARYIETIYGKGYRLKVSVSTEKKDDTLTHKKNVAILPFSGESHGDDAALQHYIIQSMMYDTVPGVNIIPASLAQYYKKLDIFNELVSRLHIDYYITGSFFTHGSGNMLFAELVDASSHQLIDIKSTDCCSSTDISGLLHNMVSQVSEFRI